jgi:hypothetical protein
MPSTHVENRPPDLAGRKVSWGSCRKQAFVHFVEDIPCRQVAEGRIGLGADHRQLGTRSEEEKDVHRSAGSRVAVHAEDQAAGLRLVALAEQPQRADVLRRLCGPALPPSCEPSIPCGSP